MEDFKIDAAMDVPAVVELIVSQLGKSDSYKIDTVKNADGSYTCTMHDVFISTDDLEDYFREIGLHVDFIDYLCEYHACGNGGAVVQDYVPVTMTYDQYVKIKAKFPYSVLLEDNSCNEVDPEEYRTDGGDFEVQIACTADLDF